MHWDVVSFLTDYHISFYTEGKNTQVGWVNIDCPFCGDSRGGGFNVDAGYYNCWRCGGHYITKVIQKLLTVDYAQAAGVEKKYTGRQSLLLQLNGKKPKAKQITTVTPPGGRLKKKHRKYLESRNFDPDELIEKYDITGTGNNEKYKDVWFDNRIIIPIKDEQGRVLSFQGRDITGRSSLRYKGCPLELSVYNYKDTLYNIGNATGNRILLVEGVFDVWRLGAGSVASFGTALTNKQLGVLSGYDTIFMMFDNEPEAQAKAKKGAAKLSSMGKEVELIELDGDGDPGDLTPKQAREIMGELGFNMFYKVV